MVPALAVRQIGRAPALAAAALVTGYQRYLSPHKGFCCAHRVLHGGRSCSGHAKSLLLRRGLLTAFAGMRRRFAACATAAAVLAAHAAERRRRHDAGSGAAEVAGQCCQAFPDACATHACPEDLSALADVGACLSF